MSVFTIVTASYTVYLLNYIIIAEHALPERREFISVGSTCYESKRTPTTDRIEILAQHAGSIGAYAEQVHLKNAILNYQRTFMIDL